MVVVALIFTVLINSLYETISNSRYEQITYDVFEEMLDNNQVDSVEFQSDRILILSRDEAKKDPREQKIYYTGIIPNLELS